MRGDGAGRKEQAVGDLSVGQAASGEDTLGQLGVIESVYPAGLSVHEHVHDGEDEMFYLLSGTAEFRFADPGSPTLIQDRDGASSLYVLMPLRV